MSAPFSLRTSLIAIAAAGALAVACNDDDNTSPPGIAMQLVPATVSVAQDGSGRSTALITRVSASAEAIDMSATGQPAGITVGFVPEMLPDGSFTARILLNVTATTALGSYPITIRADAGAVGDATATLTVNVVAPGAGAFTFRPDSATLTVLSEGPSSTVINIVRTAPFTGPVDFTVVGLPPGMTATLTPASATGATTTLQLAMGAGAEGGRYTVEIRGTATGLPDQTYRLGLHAFNASDPEHGGDHGMTLALTPTALTVAAGGASDTATVAVTRVGGWVGEVDFEVWNVPAGVTVQVVPATGLLADEALVIVRASALAESGTYTLTVFGNSPLDWLYDTKTLTVTVNGGV